MIKVLYLPLNTPDIIQYGMYNAFKAIGVELHVFDFYQKMIVDKMSIANIRHEFIQKIRELQPNLVHMQLQFTSVIDDTTIIAARNVSNKTIFTNWTGDIRNNVPGEFVQISKVVDYSLISSVGQIELYENAGCKNVKYWQIGYNPDLYFPKYNTNFKYDVSFAGAYYGDQFPGSKVRLDAVKVLQNTLGDKFGLFGASFPSDVITNGQIPQSEVNDIYANSMCVLSINNFNDVSYYFSDRLLMCLASGRPTISFKFPGCENYFQDKGDLIIANNVEEIVSAVNYLKNNINEANRIGKNGYRKVIAEHSYSSRALELLNIVKDKL